MSKPRASALDRSMSGFENSPRRIAIAVLLLLVGIAWIVVFAKYAAPHAFWQEGFGKEPSNPIPWMAKLKLWNYLIGFGLILASLWVAARSFGLPHARRPNLAVRVHSLLVALSATGMALYLGMNHWVGLRLWAW